MVVFVFCVKSLKIKCLLGRKGFVQTYPVMIFAYSWKVKLPEIYAELSLDTIYQQYRYLGGALTGIVSTSLTLESGVNGGNNDDSTVCLS